MVLLGVLGVSPNKPGMDFHGDLSEWEYIGYACYETAKRQKFWAISQFTPQDARSPLRIALALYRVFFFKILVYVLAGYLPPLLPFYEVLHFI